MNYLMEDFFEKIIIILNNCQNVISYQKKSVSNKITNSSMNRAEQTNAKVIANNSLLNWLIDHFICTAILIVLNFSILSCSNVLVFCETMSLINHETYCDSFEQWRQ